MLPACCVPACRLTIPVIPGSATNTRIAFLSPEIAITRQDRESHIVVKQPYQIHTTSDWSPGPSPRVEPIDTDQQPTRQAGIRSMAGVGRSFLPEKTFAVRQFVFWRTSGQRCPVSLQFTSFGRRRSHPVAKSSPGLEKGSGTNSAQHRWGRNFRITKEGLEKGSGTNSAQHPSGYLAIGS